ncbi:MAG: DMT family transporter [Clostridiales bacterium]|nr:DMT family transporter [Clostridiales bacterium]
MRRDSRRITDTTMTSSDKNGEKTYGRKAMKSARIGAAQVALAAISWSFAGVLGKALPWDPITVNGVRSLVAAVLLCLVRGSWRVRLSRGNVLGALGVSLTGFLFMLANRLTTSANAIVLQYAMPVFVILFSWLFYGQKPGRRSVIVAGVILFGVALCSWEGLSGGSMTGDALALMSAVTFALVYFCARMPDTDPRDYSYLGLLFCAPFALTGLLPGHATLVPAHWLIAAAMGLCLAGGYFFLSLSMKNVPPVTAALLSNLEPVLNPVWVFLILGERPGPLTIAGAGIVLVTATVYALT